MPYFDIHCHLDKLSDPTQAVQDAKKKGLDLILTNGLNYESNKQMLALAKQYDIVQAALGLYPNDAARLSAQEVADVLNQIRTNKPVAIGEVGLDYHHDDSHKQEMKEVFEKILVLAREINRPVIIHSRKAEADVVEMLDEFSDVRAVLHCFSGKLSLAKQAASRKAYFSIPAIISKSSHFQRLVEEIPLRLLLTETDSPYLSRDDNENTPSAVVKTVQVIAETKGMLVSEVKNQLWLNKNRLLR